MVHTLRAPPSTLLCSDSTPLPFSYRLTVSTIRLTRHPTAATATHDSVLNDSAYTHTDCLTHSALTLRTSQDLLAQVKTCWAHLMLPLGKNKKNAEMSSPTRLPTVIYRPQCRTPSFPLFGPQSHHSRSHSLQSLFVGFFGGHLAFALLLDDFPATSSRHFPQPRQP